MKKPVKLRWLCSCLLGSSGVTVLMFMARVLYTGHLTYGFLLWNLWLAWLPFVVSVLLFTVQRHYGRSWWLLPLSCIWLVLFPNAPYIITDLTHLQLLGAIHGAPLWFDVLLVFDFALQGMLLGFVSLYLVEQAMKQFIKPVWLYSGVGVILLLTSFGMYLGRFLRWNSWDVLTQPQAVLTDITDRLINPLAHPRTIVFTLFYFLFLTSVYTTLRVLMQYHSASAKQ